MTKSESQKPDYESLKAELDKIMLDLTSDDLDVDQALTRYRRGLELVQELEKYLQSAKNTVKELKAKFNTSRQ